MAPKKATSSSGAATPSEATPTRASQVKQLVKKYESLISGDTFISLSATSSPNTLGLGPAFLASIPSSFGPFYPPLDEEPLKHQQGVDVSKALSSNAIRSWPVPSAE